ncbi:uncharacterized protein LOC119789866 isoform X3 [Cyprinodon tularosa]|uniref:uncharacterized protein LOC119789866 isoform X3 n=1 Tax=Cyprinodon tularosa TaxID=77115 RepID=UPI0018E25B91|nr:uncharacterized protein LOC119789866 isoform X3 [Cyprinodon tularosa]
MEESMFLCNTSAIKDWSYFLSKILPLMNKTTGLVSLDKSETATTTVVTSLQPDGAMSASNPPPDSNQTSGGGRSIVAEGDGGETTDPDWVFDPRRPANRNKTEISCVTSNTHEMSELAESYVSLNHTSCLSPSRPEVTVFTVDETIEQRLPEAHCGT